VSEPLSVRFVAARDDLGIVESVIAQLKSAIEKPAVWKSPDARCQLPDFKISASDARG
jgi:hypothetical protein